MRWEYDYTQIKRMRELCGISQEELADAVGLSRTSYIDIEKGRVNPKIDHLVNIANVLNIDLKFFVTNASSDETVEIDRPTLFRLVTLAYEFTELARPILKKKK